MEGVVLYVKLVKVLVTHTKYYIAAFTVTSYGKRLKLSPNVGITNSSIGIPLTYMAVVVPIGFLVNTDRNITGHYGVYGSDTERSEGEQLQA